MRLLDVAIYVLTFAVAVIVVKILADMLDASDRDDAHDPLTAEIPPHGRDTP